MKENNHNICVIYLLNGTDRHFDSIEMFLACLKINMKHSKTIDVETCRLWPVTTQCTIWLFPTVAMCVKQSRPMRRLDTSVAKGKCLHNVTGISGTQSQLCWHSRCANVMSCHYWTVWVGQGPGPVYFWSCSLEFPPFLSLFHIPNGFAY